jgi:hypothetical protein
MTKPNMNRRNFLKGTAGTLGAATQISGMTLHASDDRQQHANNSLPPSRIEYPRSFCGPALKMISFPLGGVAAGSLGLGGRGQLRDWEIFNRPNKGFSPS